MTKRQQRRERWRRRGQRAEQPKEGGLRLSFLLDWTAFRAAMDRLSQVAAPMAEALRQVGIAMNNASIRGAVARYTELEQDALRLAYDTPLLPEQARSLVREHGLEFAQRVGELVRQGADIAWAVEALRGRLGRFDEAAAMLRLGEIDLAQVRFDIDLAQVRFDTGALQATPFMQPQRLLRGRCASIPYYFYPRCDWPPKHGTPSGFGEVCSDAAVARHQPVLTHCAGCRNHDDNPYLSCAVHPLGRPGHECRDWEYKAPEAAKVEPEWIEAVGYVNGRFQTIGMIRAS